jgi:hypothetical protein
VLTLAASLVLTGLVLTALLWAGTTWVQGYLYENVTAAGELVWRAPAAGAALALFLALWCFLDYRGYTPSWPLPYDSIFRVGLREEQPPVKEFVAVRQGQQQKYTARKTVRGGLGISRTEYVDEQGKPWSRSDAIIVKEGDNDVRFEAEKDEKGNYKVEKGASLRYIDPRGRVMTEDLPGQWSVTRTGLFFANVLLNGAHLAVWFLCLWLLLRFQWSHALGLAVVSWLVMTLVFVPMVLDQVKDVASKKAPPGQPPPSEDVHDVAVLHDVGLAFQPVDAVVLRLLHRADAAEVGVGDHLGADEALGQVGVDLARPLDGVGPLAQAPGPALVLADGEEDDLVHGVVDRPQHLAA